MSHHMKRRQFIQAMGAGAAAMGLPGSISAASSEQKRPNILWITCEDISPDLGCYGVTDVETPNLDRFAEQGVRYTRAFAHAGVCAPARSGLITGMYPTTIGSMHMRTLNSGGRFDYFPSTLPQYGYEATPPPYVKCFTEYLRAAGYYCTNRTKTDYQFQPPITAWDRIIPFNQGGADWRDRDEGQPFFTVINFTSTHESQIRTPEGRKAKHDPARVTLPPYYPDTPVVRNDYACYLENIENLDSKVQEILDWLEEDGLADDTVVFFYGDHGRGLPRAKRWIYDSGIHVPLMIRWPDVLEPGTVVDDLVSFIDFAPTVLSVAGVEVPEHLQGKAFLGEQKTSPRDYIYAARDRMDTPYDRIRAVRDKRYKYIRNYQPEKPYVQPIAYRDMMPTMQELLRLNAEGKLKGAEKLWFRTTKPVDELYDTLADPHEVNNLAGNPEYEDILVRMRKVHEYWVLETGDLGGIPEPEMVERMWPDLIQPETQKPAINPGSGSFNGSVKVRISCPTEGASIAYTTDPGENPHWKLYAGELTFNRTVTLRARAIRIGYRESAEVQARFTIG